MKVKIYKDSGVSAESFYHTIKSLRKFTTKNIEAISKNEIIHQNNIFENTALFILPGGADLPYCKDLNGAGNKRIKEFITEGGCFLGICAGAYYASSAIIFAENSAFEIKGKRELALYEGISIGPAFGDYYYNSHKGAKAITVCNFTNITGNINNKINLFYNGGGYFSEKHEKKEVKQKFNIIASYYSNSMPAIISFKYGKGKILLSHLHFEYDPFLLKSNDIDITSLINKLKETNEERINLFCYIMKELNI